MYNNLNYEIINIENIIEEGMFVFSSYILLNRCIPDLRDGMKPVHRRIIYTFHKEDATSFVKSATLSGKVFKIHAHGDTYQTMVGMAQEDAQLVPWLTGKGNFGQHTSRDLQAAASRYSELKLSDFSKYCLKNLNKKTVNYIPNYDGTTSMPEVIPVKFPTILTYTQSGIGVGMASKIPSFNMIEVSDAICKYIETGEKDMLVPDFSTGGSIILDENEIKKINELGKGSIKIRATYEKHDNKIIITSIPYTSTREAIIEKIVELVKDGKIKDIVNLNDITGLDYMGIEIECKNNSDLDNVMDKLYSLTPLEDSFSANMNVISNKLPKLMGTWNIIEEWLEWRSECIIRATNHDINDLKAKISTLNAYERVANYTNELVNVIRLSKEEDLITNISNEFLINEEDSQRIADMKLRNINKEYMTKEVKKKVKLEEELAYKEKLVSDKSEILNLIKKEVKEVSDSFGQDRRTSILDKSKIRVISKEDKIEDYGCRIIYTKDYIKKHLKQSNNHKFKEDEVIIDDIATTNKSTLLVITNIGNRYKIPVHTLETKLPSAMGTYIHNILKLEDNEEVIKIMSVENPQGYIINIYDDGRIAKVDVNSYMSNSTKLVNCLCADSNLIAIDYIKKDTDILLIASDSKALIINSALIGSKKSKNSQGNVAIKLGEGCRVVYAKIDPDNDLHISVKTTNDKDYVFFLNDIASTGKSNEDRSLYEYITGKNGNKGNKIISGNKEIFSVQNIK